MRPPALELTALRQLLFWRGVLALALAFVAVRWPQDTLLFALVGVGAVFLVMGAIDTVIALRLRASARFWWVALAHGLACVLFGAVTLAVPALALRVAVVLASLWLLAYGALALVAARKLRAIAAPWLMPALWGAANATLAVVLFVYPIPTVTVVLYAGAGYAALLGAAHLAAAFALRRVGTPTAA
jgi:uncharacterized membrane protein HdeD (DUF308 family)